MVEVGIGIDVGGTDIKYGLVTRAGVVRKRAALPPEGAEGRPGIERGVRAAVAAGQEHARRLRLDVAAVGMGIPGTVTGRRGTMLMTPPQIPGLGGWEAATFLRSLTDVPVAVDNDATVAGLAEARIGAGRGAATVILVTVGTGLGGALVVGGELVRGRHGTGGEIGHALFVPGGLPCAHGGRGCLELYTSATALVRIYREMGGRHADSPRDIVSKARQGHRRAGRALAQLGRNLGQGVSSLANVVAPDLVVVGGGLSAAGRLLIGPAREAFKEQCLPYAARGVRWVKAGLGNKAGLIGAGLLALEEGL